MASHWWDASAIYGSDADTTGKLRSHQGGKLQTENRLLPVDATTQIVNTGFTTNWWVGLEMLHTLFAMEHNAICDRLQLEFPDWDDEQLFQTARLINAALMAKIHTDGMDARDPWPSGAQIRHAGELVGPCRRALTKLIGRIGRWRGLQWHHGLADTTIRTCPSRLPKISCRRLPHASVLPDEIAFRRLATGEVVKTLKMEEVLREKSTR